MKLESIQDPDVFRREVVQRIDASRSADEVLTAIEEANAILDRRMDRLCWGISFYLVLGVIMATGCNAFNYVPLEAGVGIAVAVFNAVWLVRRYRVWNRESMVVLPGQIGKAWKVRKEVASS